jgi:hypothetical protein
MEDRRTRKLIKTLGAALAAALLAVPVAQARLDPGQGVARSKPVIRTDARHAGLAQRTGARVVIVKSHPEGQIAQLHRHPAQVNLPAGQTGDTESSSAIDWSDAGIGAASALGLVLLTGGGVLITRRRLVGA